MSVTPMYLVPISICLAAIVNLVEAVQDEEERERYREVFDIALGDTVLLMSKSTGILKIVLSPDVEHQSVFADAD